MSDTSEIKLMKLEHEIVLTEPYDILKELENLTESNWIKLTNKHFEDVNIIICKTKCEVFKGMNMILKDCVTIYFENVDIYSSRVIPINMLKYYLKLLLNETNKRNIQYISLLMLHQLKVGDVITFTNGKKGVILAQNKDYINQLKYRLIKKDSSLGKLELGLYGDSEYTVNGRELINYEGMV